MKYNLEEIKKLTIENKKKNPRSYSRVNVDKYIQNQVVNNENLIEDCKLPILKKTYDPKRYKRFQSIDTKITPKLQGYGQSPKPLQNQGPLFEQIRNQKREELSSIKKKLEGKLKNIVVEGKKPVQFRKKYDQFSK